MRQSYYIFLVGALVSSIKAAPQFITFTDGKLGVNFGGYHAGVGIGGGGGKGGLFAEAGTPHGQAAVAGLGGSVDDRFGGPTGGLFAGATAGGDVKASAGLAGRVENNKSAGIGFAQAQAADRFSSVGMEGETSIHGDVSFSKSKSYAPKQFVKETNIEVQPIQPIHTKVYKKVHTKLIEDVNPPPVATVEKTQEVNEVSRQWSPFGSFERRHPVFQGFLSSMFRIGSHEKFGHTWTRPQETMKDNFAKVYVPAPPPTKVVEKTYVHTHVHKPHRHHLRKTAYIGGYVGGEAPPPQVHVKSYQPAIEKRVDVGVEGDVHPAGASQIGYRKEVTFQRNPNFFADIFNIPISTLKAVGSFLGNTAASTNVSVQKTASFEKDPLSPKHGASSSSNTHTVSVEAPTASKFIDDIFAIPINTLGAVNKFLENNVAARKKVHVSDDGAVEQERTRLGPHARRRANKQVVVYQNTDSQNDDSH